MNELFAANTSKNRLRYRVYVLMVGALVVLGLADSIYLAISHYRVHTDAGYQSFCALSKAMNCDTVSQSPASVLINLPVAIWGASRLQFLPCTRFVLCLSVRRIPACLDLVLCACITLQHRKPDFRRHIIQNRNLLHPLRPLILYQSDVAIFLFDHSTPVYCGKSLDIVRPRSAVLVAKTKAYHTARHSVRCRAALG